MKRIFLTALTLSLAAFSFAVFRMEQSADNSPLSANSYMDDIRVTASKDGNRMWSLTSKRAEISDEKGIVRMHAVRITLPKEGITIESDSGVYDIGNSNFSFNEGIRAGINEYVIKAGSLNFRAEKGELTANGKILLEGKGLRIEGSGLKADKGQRVKLMNDVKAVFY